MKDDGQGTMCVDCIHKSYCSSCGEEEAFDCLVFEPEDRWLEMSYYHLQPKTMLQRLREGE